MNCAISVAVSSRQKQACRARCVARQCGRWQLGPAEFFAGIPGSVGGALRMNAGAFGGETWNSVIEVDVVDRRGVVHTRPRDAYETGYRHVQQAG